MRTEHNTTIHARPGECIYGWGTMTRAERETILAHWDGATKMCPSVIAKLLDSPASRPRNDEDDDEVDE